MGRGALLGQLREPRSTTLNRPTDSPTWSEVDRQIEGDRARVWIDRGVDRQIDR